MKKLQDEAVTLIKQIPERISNSDVIIILQKNEINWLHLKKFKDITTRGDVVLSHWLNISVRTFRNYQKPGIRFNENFKERLVLLFSLYKHGAEVFGSFEEFNEWLATKNFFFDGESPESFLKTVSGIMFVENRLTAMEYGDNV